MDGDGRAAPDPAPPAPAWPARSTAGLLAWIWAAAIVYASLYPFAGWRWPPGLAWGEALRLPPWPRLFIAFDVVANLLGYLPLGLLAALAALRAGRPALAAGATALAAGATLSYAMELAQHLLPARVPSRPDWLLNVCGTFAGALLALAAAALGWLRRWQRLRERWLDGFAASGFALLLLWPAALLPPAPLPLALGHVVEALRDAAIDVLLDVPGAAVAVGWLDAIEPPVEPLAPWLEVAVSGCGLLAPCLVGFAMARGAATRIALALVTAAAALGATSLSAALNFGPPHALAWLSAPALAGATAALALALALAALDASPRAAAAVGVAALVAMLALVQQAPADPYFALSLETWERGQFVRLNGLARWIAGLWPFAALAWLAVRLARKVVRPLPARRRWRIARPASTASHRPRPPQRRRTPRRDGLRGALPTIRRG